MNKITHRAEDICIVPQTFPLQNTIQHINDYFGPETISDRIWFYGTYSISLIIITFIIIVLNS